MRRKKEVLFIILILIVTLALVLLPFIINNKNEVIKDDNNTKTNNQTIIIKIEGEINYSLDLFDDSSLKNEMSLTMPKGVSMGDISRVIDIYYTKYSVKPKDYQTRFYKDTTIVIKSTYTKIDDKEISDADLNKININTGTLKELKSLYGIGDVRAEIIIEYRETKKIESYSELKSILGVSDEIIEIIKESSVL